MSKKLDLLHVITVSMLENLKPGIYISDPIAKPKYCKEGKPVFCPFCSYPKNHFYVKKDEFYDHLKSKGHLKQFVDHHCPNLKRTDFEKILIVNFK